MVFTYGNNTKLFVTLRDIFTLVGSASIIGILSYLIENNKVFESTFLSDSSFFIFAAHNVSLLAIVMKYTSRIIPSLSQFALIIKYFAAPSITIIILLGCYYLMSLLTPKLLAFLTGGR